MTKTGTSKRAAGASWVSVKDLKWYILVVVSPAILQHCFSLLLLLSRFSCFRLCTTPYTAAHQAPPSLGFSRQEHWSGLPCPSPMHESEKWKWSQSCLTLHDPKDCSLPGSFVHGIFQARVLEGSAISFSTAFPYLALFLRITPFKK